MWRCIFILLILVNSVSLAQSRIHYRGQMYVDPDKGFIHGLIRISVPNEIHKDTVRFLLHEDLAIHSVVGHLITTYQIAPATNLDGSRIPFTQVIIIPPVSDIRAHHFWIEYAGSISNNHLQLGHAWISLQWTELNNSAIWIPLEASLKNKFTCHIEITLPKEFELVGMDNTTNKKRAGRWLLKQADPKSDLILTISSISGQRNSRN